MDGDMGNPLTTDRKCPKCGGKCFYQEWTADDGGHVDERFTCTACGHQWWVDGTRSPKR